MAEFVKGEVITIAEVKFGEGMDELRQRAKAAAQRIRRMETYEDWMTLAEFVNAGRRGIMSHLGINQPTVGGGKYSAYFRQFLDNEGLQWLQKGTLMNMQQCLDNRVAIEEWRATRPAEQQRLDWVSPNTIWPKFKASRKVPVGGAMQTNAKDEVIRKLTGELYEKDKLIDAMRRDETPRLEASQRRGEWYCRRAWQLLSIARQQRKELRQQSKHVQELTEELYRLRVERASALARLSGGPPLDDVAGLTARTPMVQAGFTIMGSMADQADRNAAGEGVRPSGAAPDLWAFLDKLRHDSYVAALVGGWQVSRHVKARADDADATGATAGALVLASPPIVDIGEAEIAAPPNDDDPIAFVPLLLDPGPSEKKLHRKLTAAIEADVQRGIMARGDLIAKVSYFAIRDGSDGRYFGALDGYGKLQWHPMLGEHLGIEPNGKGTIVYVEPPNGRPVMVDCSFTRARALVNQYLSHIGLNKLPRKRRSG